MLSLRFIVALKKRINAGQSIYNLGFLFSELSSAQTRSSLFSSLVSFFITFFVTFFHFLSPFVLKVGNFRSSHSPHI